MPHTVASLSWVPPGRAWTLIAGRNGAQDDRRAGRLGCGHGVSGKACAVATWVGETCYGSRARAVRRMQKGRPTPRSGRPFRRSERQLLPRKIARMRRISTYSHTTVTMMPKAPSQAYWRGAPLRTPCWIESKSSTSE